jgi:histidinol phosphatase-like PHP family hydrolase
LQFLERKLAIEINEVSHIPDETFITRAKKAGLEFTFGTDSRNEHATHFCHCYEMAQKCGLTAGHVCSEEGINTTESCQS